MSEKKSFFVKILDGITFTRQLVLNILFIIALIMVVMFISSLGKDNRLIIKDGSTLVVDISGSIVEQHTQDPLNNLLTQISGGDVVGEMRLYDLLNALDNAKNDPRISQVYIKADTLHSAGYAQLREISSKIKEVKDSGKKVIVFAKNISQKQYLLSSNASEIYLDPDGSFLIEGLSGYRQYFREALQDKLGVNIQLFRVGEFKSAVEPFILDGASEESKKADLYWMNDIWDRYISDISSARNLDKDILTHQISNIDILAEKYNGDLAKIALEQKLIDGLKTEEEVESILKENGVVDTSGKDLATIGVRSYIKDMNSAQFTSLKNKKVAIVVAQGEIVDGEGDRSSIGGDYTSDMLRVVREDNSVSAVVLRVDSPGGAVFASEQIRREVELIKKSGRPVVISMGNTAASGGYWISMNGDIIMADPSTITGSIGIFGLVPDLSGSLKKIGITTDGVATTPIAGSFDITRPLDPKLGNVIQSIINNGYSKFINKVSLARQMDIDQVDENARGRVWSGAQAVDRGLVDKLGGLQDAIKEAKRLADLDDNAYVFIADKAPSGSFSNWLVAAHSNKLSSVIAEKLGVWSLISSMSTVKNNPSVSILEKSLQAKPGKPVTTISHCLCEI